MAGTHSLVPGRAFEDSEQSGAKGIVQLCEDIVAVVRDNTFGGIFFAPPADITCKLYENKNSGGIAWNAGVGAKKTLANHPDTAANRAYYAAFYAVSALFSAG